MIFLYCVQTYRLALVILLICCLLYGHACWQTKQWCVLYATHSRASHTCCRSAPVGQASSQRWQSPQMSFCSLAFPHSTSHCSTNSPGCTILPNSGCISWWLRPICPNPANTAQRRSKNGAESQKMCCPAPTISSPYRSRSNASHWYSFDLTALW